MTLSCGYVTIEPIIFKLDDTKLSYVWWLYNVLCICILSSLIRQLQI